MMTSEVKDVIKRLASIMLPSGFFRRFDILESRRSMALIMKGLHCDQAFEVR